MPGLVGMDVAAVQALATRIDAQAHALGSVISAVDALVSQSTSEWQGADAHQFAQWWQSQHRPRLVVAQTSVAGLARSATANASEQTDASAVRVGVGAATLTSAALASAGKAAQPPNVGVVPPPSPAQGSDSRAGAVAAFVGAHPSNQRLGDGECVAVFTAYNRDVVHAPPIGVGANNGAKDFYQRFDSLPHANGYYDRIPVTDPPQVGDVVVWNAHPGNPYGHIAVITGTQSGSMTVLEQNAPWHSPIREHVYTNSSGVLGYLRPKHI